MWEADRLLSFDSGRGSLREVHGERDLLRLYKKEAGGNFKWGGTWHRFGILELLELGQFLSQGKDLMKLRVNQANGHESWLCPLHLLTVWLCDLGGEMVSL